MVRVAVLCHVGTVCLLAGRLQYPTRALSYTKTLPGNLPGDSTQRHTQYVTAPPPQCQAISETRH